MLAVVLIAPSQDPDAIPDKYLGLWLHADKPFAMLKITEDGRVNYQRPKCLEPPADSRKVRVSASLSPKVARDSLSGVFLQGKMRELTGQVMRVNLLSKVCDDVRC